MNALGLLLLGSIAHATAFAIAGIVAYLALRRWGPAAGSLAAASSLGIMVLVSIIVLSPWPRWWSFRGGERPGAAVFSTREAVAAVSPAESVGPTASDPASPELRLPALPSIEPTPSLLGVFLDELQKPRSVAGSDRWSWREWLAAGFLACLAIGAARLGLGLRGVAWLRARSRPVEDRGLEELLEVLAAELGCTRGVTLREASELTTPATIGWRRPVVLLPFNWRDWDDDERRAVLAHELAHVCCGDFLVGLAAQLAVALQFYHPLAHWLAARLRLEQELVADAWGARLTGGPSSYLATLAQMALRHDSPVLTSPARAFLPSHGTLVRRIEMLKNHGPIGNVTLPPFARALTITILAAIGLLVAGLRGPGGDTPALAQDRPAEQPAAGEATGAYNLTFVPADARMIVAMRPQSLLRRRDIMSFVNALRQNSFGGNNLPVPPEEIEQVIVFWEASPPAVSPLDRPSPIPSPSGVVVRTSKAQDWNAVLTKLPGPGLEALRHDGQPYHRFRANGPVTIAAYSPDDRTIVVAEEVVLRDVIADRNAPPPRFAWDESWKRVNKGQAMVALDTRWLRRRLVQATGPGPAATEMLRFETFAPLYERAQSYAVSFTASDQSLAMDLVAMAGSAQNAKPVADTLQALLTLGRNVVQSLRRQVDRRAPLDEAKEWILQAADSALEKSRLETTEGFVRLHAESPVDLAEGIRLLLPAVEIARAAARRAQSVNNLKQIGLAFFNYASANNHFPAGVNLDKGKFPYSWRVAILPYIEQQGLYNEYHFDEPWDGPNNRKLIDRMPVVYARPVPDGTPTTRGNASYFVFTGPSTIGGAEGGAKFDQITDGVSNTLLAVEAKRDIPWTKPDDLSFDPHGRLPDLGGFTPGGFNALFADGSVRYFKTSIKPMLLKAMITRDGSEVISNDSY
jgi:prepilin-type processing-associated H-X9-DG protein